MTHLDVPAPPQKSDKISLPAITGVMTTIGAGFMAMAMNWERVEPMMNSQVFVFIALFAMLILGFTACYFLIAQPLARRLSAVNKLLREASEHAHDCEIALARLEERLAALEDGLS
mgnify:CR=1 FL=1